MTVNGARGVRVCLPLLASAALAAGCGSSSSSSQTGRASAPAQGARTAASPGAASAVLLTTKQSKLGTILAAGDKRLTVYLFEADKGSRSSCSGACASVWPPVTGNPTAAGHARAAEIGTSARPDGTTQATYKGHPLYYYAKDMDSGDAYGQGSKQFGAGWYVLAPSGSKIDKS